MTRDEQHYIHFFVIHRKNHLLENVPPPFKKPSADKYYSHFHCHHMNALEMRYGTIARLFGAPRTSSVNTILFSWIFTFWPIVGFFTGHGSSYSEVCQNKLPAYFSDLFSTVSALWPEMMSHAPSARILVSLVMCLTKGAAPTLFMWVWLCLRANTIFTSIRTLVAFHIISSQRAVNVENKSEKSGGSLFWETSEYDEPCLVKTLQQVKTRNFMKKGLCLRCSFSVLWWVLRLYHTSFEALWCGCIDHVNIVCRRRFFKRRRQVFQQMVFSYVSQKVGYYASRPSSFFKLFIFGKPVHHCTYPPSFDFSIFFFWKYLTRTEPLKVGKRYQIMKKIEKTKLGG